MSFDLRAAVRQRKPDKRVSRPKARPLGDLIGWRRVAVGLPAVVLDTNVYIHRAAGRLPPELRDAIDRTLLFHSSVALSEIAVGVAHADPTREGWKRVRDHYAALFDAIPRTRLLTPDAETWGDAGLVAGTLARTQGFQAHQRKDCLSDALIYLTASKVGLPVLTSNRTEFDLIQQIAPEGRFIWY